MAKILVVYYSSYGHVEQMARAVAEGARSVPGAEVHLKRVPELVPEEAARKAGIKLDQEAPIASPKELADYDAMEDVNLVAEGIEAEVKQLLEATDASEKRTKARKQKQGQGRKEPTDSGQATTSA